MPPPTPQSPALDLATLNPAQRQAVTGPAGPLLILAGPGSGKTRVIAHRIAYLVRETGVPPWRILAVTFTNKAAREMRARVESLLPGGPDDLGTRGMALGTFHAVCAQILRRDGEAVGVPRGFVIYDDADQLAIVKRTLVELGVDTRTHPARRVLGAISRAKNEGLGAATVRAHAGDYFQEIVARTFEHYQTALHDNAAVDFDDLLGRTLELFTTQPAIAARYQERFEHVLVDEFQDTNIVQYRLARAWAAGYGSLTVVGDPDQSIYSWRAADIRNILHFARDFPDATTVRLEQNYRSTKAICRVADAVIDKAAERIHKQLWTDNAEGDRPVVFEAYTEVEEADEVGREIESRVAAGDWRPGDVAVCYRTNAQSRAVEEAFLRRGIPYRLIGGTRFYARREIKDLLALCRLVLNPHDDVAFERMVNVPGRGIGQRTRALLLDWADRHDTSLSQAALTAVRAATAPSDGSDDPDAAPTVTPRARAALQSFLAIIGGARERAADGTVGQIIDQLLRDTGYQDYLYRTYDDGEDRWNNVQELRTVAANYDALSPAPPRRSARRAQRRRRRARRRPRHLPRRCRPRRRRRRPGGGPERRHADHPARRQGPRVPRRLPDRHGGAHPAPLPLARRPGRARGGAPPLLRGHDPRPALALLRLRLPPRARRPRRPQPALALPGRPAGRRHRPPRPRRLFGPRPDQPRRPPGPQPLAHLGRRRLGAAQPERSRPAARPARHPPVRPLGRRRPRPRRPARSAQPPRDPRRLRRRTAAVPRRGSPPPRRPRHASGLRPRHRRRRHPVGPRRHGADGRV